eukprot:SAG11_NODE_3418_length_2460_cov_2.180008_3_plen_239_part_00
MFSTKVRERERRSSQSPPQSASLSQLVEPTTVVVAATAGGLSSVSTGSTTAGAAPQGVVPNSPMMLTSAETDEHAWLEERTPPSEAALFAGRDWDVDDVANWAAVVSQPASEALRAHAVDGEALVAVPSYAVLHELLLSPVQEVVGSLGAEAVGMRRAATTALGSFSAEASRSSFATPVPSDGQRHKQLRGASLKLWGRLEALRAEGREGWGALRHGLYRRVPSQFESNAYKMLIIRR